MMNYLSFGIKNYKGIESVKVSLGETGKPILLVGDNESGKTTILEAICLIGRHCQYLHACKYGKLLGTEKLIVKRDAWLMERQVNDIIPRRQEPFSGSTVLSCTVSDGGRNKTISFIYSHKNAKHISYAIELHGTRIDEKADWGDREEALSKRISEELPQIIFYDDFSFTIPKGVKFYTTRYKTNLGEEQHRGLDKEERKPDGIRNQFWKDVFEDIACSCAGEQPSPQDGERPSLFQKNVVDYLDGDPLDGSNPGSTNLFRDILLRHSKHLNEKIVDKWLSYLPRGASLKEVDIVCDNHNANSDDARTFSIQAKSKQGQSYDMSSRSKGCQWFFAFMLLTEFRKYRRRNTIFLLDEPASNLHALRQEQIVVALNELGGDAGTRVMYSTHSPYLLDIDNMSTTYLVQNVNASSETKDPRIQIRAYLSHPSNGHGTETIMDYFRLSASKYQEKIEATLKRPEYKKLRDVLIKVAAIHWLT